MELLLFALLLVGGFIVYFTPLIVALARGRLIAAVAVVNILLGWTLLGWVVALVMAVTERSTKEEERRLIAIRANEEYENQRRKGAAEAAP